jgi:hypothetical protein
LEVGRKKKKEKLFMTTIVCIPYITQVHLGILKKHKDDLLFVLGSDIAERIGIKPDARTLSSSYIVTMLRSLGFDGARAVLRGNLEHLDNLDDIFLLMPSQEAGQEFMRLYLSEERQKRTRLVVA